MPSAASTFPSSPASVAARGVPSWLVIVVLCVSLACAAVARAADGVSSPAILVLGDSLSAAFGIRVEQGWAALLQARLRAKGYGHRVINASSSGETTGGALARLPRALATHRPTVVVVELGGNDGLRGLPVADIRSNLDSIVQRSLQSGARVLLVGMRIPPNYGAAYTQQFHALFGEIATKHALALVPFFLEDVALDDALMQADGLHPNAAAQPKLLDEIWPRLEPLLRARK